MLHGVYSLSSNPDLARQRQNQVVYAMEAYGFLSDEEADSLLK